MNEFVGKKLGEVLAFSRVGVELFERGEAALDVVFEDHALIMAEFKRQAEEVEELAENGGVLEITQDKAVATVNKLRGMMETYIGDEWDNVAELLEWMGFFEGAAVVHWRLVEGAGQALGIEELQAVSAASADYRHELFHRLQDVIRKVGADKAS